MVLKRRLCHHPAAAGIGFLALLKPGFDDHSDREVPQPVPLLLTGGQLDWHVL
jgi:hypothetical protein